MKKKVVVLIFYFFLYGCSNSSSTFSDLDQWMQKNGKLKVLSTVAMIDDLVGEIGKERIDHISLIQGEIDPHSYELMKGDEEKFAYADLIFYNGLGLEHGASLFYKLKKHPSSHPLGDIVRQKNPEVIIETQGQVDPHIWMDVTLWKEVAVNIVHLLSLIDPDGREEYEKNGKELVTKMQKSHEEIVRLLAEVPQEKRYLVTSHDSFDYFVRAYLSEDVERESEGWRERSSAPEGLAPDGQLGSRHLQNVIAFLTKYQVDCVFPESNVNRAALKKIASVCCAMGKKIKLSKEMLYGDAMGEKGEAADTYLKMIRHNAEVIAKGLK